MTAQTPFMAQQEKLARLTEKQEPEKVQSTKKKAKKKVSKKTG